MTDNLVKNSLFWITYYVIILLYTKIVPYWAFTCTREALIKRIKNFTGKVEEDSSAATNADADADGLGWRAWLVYIYRLPIPYWYSNCRLDSWRRLFTLCKCRWFGISQERASLSLYIWDISDLNCFKELYFEE